MSRFNNHLSDYLQNARQKKYPRNQIIIYEGDPPIEVYMIKSGYVKVYDIDNEGNEKIMSIIKPGDIMPFAFFSGDDVPNKWFYQAINSTQVYVMRRDKLLQEMHDDPELMIQLVNNFSKEVHELLTRLSSLGKTNIHDKLLALIKYLVVCVGRDNSKRWWRVPFPVNQQLLADIAGITRESCSSVIQELMADKVIRSPRLYVFEIDTVKLKRYNLK